MSRDNEELRDDALDNRVEGTAKEAGGRIRNAVGGLMGDTSQQIKGKAKELEGKIQRKVGEAQDRIADET